MSRLFVIDARNLALFRIGIALVQLQDLYESHDDRCAFFSEDKGLLRIAELPGLGYRPAAFDLGVYHRFSSCEDVMMIFGIHVFCALLLLFGLFSRVSSLCCYVLLLSEHARSPLTQSSGDYLLCMSCLWASFAGVGACWSVDSMLIVWWCGVGGPAQDSSKAVGVVSCVGVLGAKLQLLLMYSTSAVIKVATKDEAGQSVWLDGRALQQALQCCDYRTLLGSHFARISPILLAWATWSILLLEAFCAPLLLVLDMLGRRQRTATGTIVLSLCSMHIIGGACLRLNNFSAASAHLAACHRRTVLL